MIFKAPLQIVTALFVYIYLMNKRVRNASVAKAQAKKRLISIIRRTAYILGFIGAGYTLREYNVTFIDWKLLIAGNIIPGFVLALILEKNYKEWFWATLCFGGLFTGTFILANNITNAPVEVMKMDIIHAGIPGYSKRSPYVTVNCVGMRKDIKLSYDLKDIVSKAHCIKLTMQKGNLGYYIVIDQQLVIDKLE
ncbi:MAG: hypothetical protein ABIN91_11600 [Mucilaginibacter sp.]|uniref:hypothetical protein n=1 Tax=Mucilaginibacter sp. TaxID=1882438 RepID=UPI0032674ABA